jgi:TRAP-type C4-dicarboxylate transport system permease small subunit
MKRAYEKLCRAEMLVARYALFALATLVFAAAVARTIRHPMNWAIDVATFLFAWCVFLGGDIAIREDRLFCIVVLTEKLPPKTQLSIKALNYAIIGLFLAGMIVYGSYLSYTTRLRTFQGIPGFSYTWVTISVPIGCALMLVSVVRRIRQILRSIREGTSLGKGEGATEVI